MVYTSIGGFPVVKLHYPTMKSPQTLLLKILRKPRYCITWDIPPNT